jgi:hypothetical protein
MAAHKMLKSAEKQAGYFFSAEAAEKKSLAEPIILIALLQL